MADAEHTLRHISYDYEILRWSVALLVPLGVCVGEAHYVNPTVSHSCSHRGESDIWDMLGDTLGRMMQCVAKMSLDN